ncbi:hypothetical protein ABK040_004874 [Willaertia magna]
MKQISIVMCLALFLGLLLMISGLSTQQTIATPPQYQMTMKRITNGVNVASTSIVSIDHLTNKFSHVFLDQTTSQPTVGLYYFGSTHTLFETRKDGNNWYCTKQNNVPIDNAAGDPLRVELYTNMTFDGKVVCNSVDSSVKGVCYKFDKRIPKHMVVDFILYTNATNNLPTQLFKQVSSQPTADLIMTYGQYKIGPLDPSNFNLPVPESTCKSVN